MILQHSWKSVLCIYLPQSGRVRTRVAIHAMVDRQDEVEYMEAKSVLSPRQVVAWTSHAHAVGPLLGVVCRSCS